jgi:hypothetical protein
VLVGLLGDGLCVVEAMIGDVSSCMMRCLRSMYKAKEDREDGPMCQTSAGKEFGPLARED